MPRMSPVGVVIGDSKATSRPLAEIAACWLGRLNWFPAESTNTRLVDPASAKGTSMVPSQIKMPRATDADAFIGSLLRLDPWTWPYQQVGVPPDHLCTKMSRTPLVSPATRLVASDANAATRP